MKFTEKGLFPVGNKGLGLLFLQDWLQNAEKYGMIGADKNRNQGGILMQKHRMNAVIRIVLASVMAVAAALLIFAHYEIHRGVTYGGLSPTANRLSDSTENPLDPLAAIHEREDLNHVIHVTLGGNCTPAALLGTDSFGTFNRMAEEEGRAVFFEGLKGIFGQDDCTVLGCAAVLSDRAFSFEELLVEDLPSLGPAENAEVFSLSSVEVLSVAHARTAALGEEGLADTKSALAAENLVWTDGETPVFVDFYGVTVGVLGVRLLPGSDAEALMENVSSAAEACDYLILYAEPQRKASDEGEAESCSELAHAFIDVGCDLVCYTGSVGEEGPTEEEYGGGVIVTSLGYLLDGSSFEGSGAALYCLSLSVKDGAVEQTEGHFVPVVYSGNPWFPEAE